MRTEQPRRSRGISGIRRRLPDHPSRTQEERSAETRAKLLDAAIESVLEVGYAQTTTRRVAELAGVSAGAQAYHFPRRVDLIASAIERFAEQRLEAWHGTADSLPAQPGERLPALADRLWGVFSSSLFTVFVKLWIAAADDAELYDRLAIVERRVALAISKVASESIADLRGQAGWEGRVLVALAAMRGLALIEHFEPWTEPRPDLWPIARAALVEMFMTSPDRASATERERTQR